MAGRPRRVALAAVVALTLAPMVVTSPIAATTMPSGQRMVGRTTFSSATGTFVGGGGSIEPAYNDVTGALIYIYTPTKAKVSPNSHNVAPLYLPTYPAGSGFDPASLNCAHVPADNCPDHGPLIAGAAMGIEPTVYGGGVLGHDHVLGVASSGGDFNFIWEPVLVLFTNAAAATHHLVTDAQIDAALDAGDIIEIPLPQADFHCAIVSASVWEKATPAPTVVGLLAPVPVGPGGAVTGRIPSAAHRRRAAGR